MSMAHEASKSALFLGSVSSPASLLDERDEPMGTGRHAPANGARDSRLGGGLVGTRLDPGHRRLIPDEIILSPELKDLIGFEDHEFPNSLASLAIRIAGRNAEEGIYRRGTAPPAGNPQLRETGTASATRTASCAHLQPQPNPAQSRRPADSLVGRGVGITDGKGTRRSCASSRARWSRARPGHHHRYRGPDRVRQPEVHRTTGYSTAEVIGKTPASCPMRVDPERLRRDVEDHPWRRRVAGRVQEPTQERRAVPGHRFDLPDQDRTARSPTSSRFRKTSPSVARSKSSCSKAQSMEAVGQLVSGVAHDFNNLLTAMIGFSDLAWRRSDDDDPRSRASDRRSARPARRAADLTRQLLAVQPAAGAAARGARPQRGHASVEMCCGA